jgi:short-subunit dehydrogenase
MNIIITGASSGIGFETALRFSNDEQNKVIVISRDKEKLNSLKEASIKQNANSHLIPLAYDISPENNSENLCSLIKKEMDSVDILINNAGKLINKLFEELTIKEIKEVYEVNVFGVMKTIQDLLPLMGKNPTHIINVGSLGGVEGTLKFKGLSAYSSSKGALLILTECLAEEFKGKNISVNYLALGSVQTEMFTAAFPGSKAQITSKEMAKFIVDFAVDGYKFINGKIIQVSKGSV